MYKWEYIKQYPDEHFDKNIYVYWRGNVGQHGGVLVRVVASQQEGLGFESTIWMFVCSLWFLSWHSGFLPQSNDMNIVGVY